MRGGLRRPLLVPDGVRDVHPVPVLVALEGAVVLLVLHLAQLENKKQKIEIPSRETPTNFGTVKSNNDE